MSVTAKKGDWVQIHEVVLNANERTAKLPEDTMKVPVELWVKGFIANDANVGDEVEIETVTGRNAKGKLIAVNPTYNYGFGDEFVPEMLKIGIQLRSILKDGDCK